MALFAAWMVSRPDVANQPATSDTAPVGGLRWHRLRIDGDSQPKPRVHGVLLLDSTSNALLVIGGVVSRGESVAESPVLGDSWRINGLDPNGSHRSTRIVPASGPSPAARWQAFGAYDAARDRAILHGGALAHSSPCANDTWILDRASGIGGAARWREVRIAGTAPPPHASMHGFLESRSRRIVTFGGNDCFATYVADVWMLAFDDSTMTSGRWTRVRPDSSAGAPGPRNADAVAYDPLARRMWVHGGDVGASQMISELWRLDHADGSDGAPSWHPVRCAGEAPALTGHVAAYDPARGTLVLFGGFDESAHPRNDVWFATGLGDGGTRCQWRHAAVDEAPLPRHTARAVMLPNGSMVVLGGAVENIAVLDLWRADRANVVVRGSRSP